MSLEKSTAAFVAWLFDRATSGTEEWEEAAAVFQHLVIDPLPSIERAMFLAKVEIQQQRLAEKAAVNLP